MKVRQDHGSIDDLEGRKELYRYDMHGEVKAWGTERETRDKKCKIMM